MGTAHLTKRAKREADYTDALSAGTMANQEIERQNLPAVVAHRGASSTHPENTIEAYEGAIASGADLVELDVRVSADGVPVVMHDPHVGATTDGSGFVHMLTLAELKRLDASKGRGPRREIPTLRESLEALSGRIGVNAEIKNLPGEPGFDYPRELAAELTLTHLQEVGFIGPVVISSFNWLSIERVRRLDPNIPTGFLTTAVIDPRASLVYVRSEGHRYVLPQASALDGAGEDFVREAHAAGILVGTWTVDDPAAVERLFAMGVDAVATNDPDMAVPIRDRYRLRPGWPGPPEPPR
jgi:glycerophosphoryl diester phosphodiesterase